MWILCPEDLNISCITPSPVVGSFKTVSKSSICLHLNHLLRFNSFQRSTSIAVLRHLRTGGRPNPPGSLRAKNLPRQCRHRRPSPVCRTLSPPPHRAGLPGPAWRGRGLRATPRPIRGKVGDRGRGAVAGPAAAEEEGGADGGEHGLPHTRWDFAITLNDCSTNTIWRVNICKT